MAFGYIPDYKGKSFFKDIYLKIFGYPYPPRKNEAALVLKFLNPQEKEKILDIGCGDGVWYLWLRKRNIEVVGIDLAQHDLNKLKERAEKLNINYETVKADAQNMPFKDKVFDKIYSISTLEHIKDDRLVFREANRVLKPNGRFIISIPLKKLPLLTRLAIKLPKSAKKIFCNQFVIKAKTQEDYFNNFNQYYFQYRNYTIKDIQEKIHQYGFIIEKQSYNCRFFGSFIWSLYQTLKILERGKSPAIDYQFRSETIFALVAPFFYLLFLIDRLLFWTKGGIIILKLKKI